MEVLALRGIGAKLRRFASTLTLIRNSSGCKLVSAPDPELSWLHECVGTAGVLIEVGANDGTDSLRLLSAFPDAELHCFEPEPRAALLWKERVRDSRASLHEVALSASDGNITFYRSDGLPPGTDSTLFPNGWHLSGSIVPPTGHLEQHPWCSFDQTIVVRSRALDSVVKDLESVRKAEIVDLIWADVQGAERDLVLGGLDTLSRTRFLYTEYSNVELYADQITLAALLELLPQFRIRRLWKNDVLLENVDLMIV